MAKSERADHSAPSHNPQQPTDARFPADFSAEEAEFGGWLNDLFDVAGEDLPPRYAQTLLGEPRHAPASDDFEDRVADQVFARLGLARPRHEPVVRRLVRQRDATRHERRKTLRTGRQVATVALALMALVSLNAIGATAALASIAQLIAGHGGAKQVAKYPTLSLPAAKPDAKIGDPSIQFLLQWPGESVEGYSYFGIDVYRSLTWTKGAVAVLHYRKEDAQGAHYLSILEFKPDAQVALQVVKDGAASQVALNSTSGVFISGKWMRQNQTTVWVPGARSEIIIPSRADATVVLWIAVDNSDASQIGPHKDLVEQIASAMGTMPFNTGSAFAGLQYLSSDLSANVAQEFNEDVVAIAPNGASSNTVLYIKIDLDGSDLTTLPGITGAG